MDQLNSYSSSPLAWHPRNFVNDKEYNVLQEFQPDHVESGDAALNEYLTVPLYSEIRDVSRRKEPQLLQRSSSGMFLSGTPFDEPVEQDGPKLRQPRIENGYRCGSPNCNRVFHTASSRKKHKFQKHTPKSERPLACGLCSEKFNYATHLRRHQARKHSPPLHQIPLARSSTLNKGIQTITAQPEASCADSRFVELIQSSTKRHHLHDSDAQISVQMNTLAANAPGALVGRGIGQAHETAEREVAACLEDFQIFLSLKAPHITIAKVIPIAPKTVLLKVDYETIPVPDEGSQPSLYSTATVQESEVSSQR